MPARARAISLLGLVPYPLGTSPSQRFRIEQWQGALQAQGIAVDLLPFADDALMRVLHQPGQRTAKAALSLLASLRRLSAVARARRYDAVLVHRAASLIGPALLERAISALGRPVILDFDDAIYLLHTSEANRALGWLKFPAKTAALCRLSRHVVVANQELAEFARRYNRHVTIVPSSVDTELFRPRPRAPRQGPLRVGWTGSSTSATHLELFAPTLRRLLEEHPIEFHVHSDRRPDLGGAPFVWHAWNPATEPEELSAFDVGVMPMPDDRWSRGKSAMKALLYMAMAIPAVCSPVGTNRDVIRHGENGLLAASESEWSEAIGALAADGALRERLGAAGRRTVVESYSLERCAHDFAGVVRGVVA